MRIAIGALLGAVGLLSGCPEPPPRQPARIESPRQSLSVGCHKEGKLFVFDNDHFAGRRRRGISTMSCANAFYNWLRMPEQGGPGRPDKKTGLLP